MKPIKPILLSFLLLLSLTLSAKDKTYTLASPDGRLVAHIWTDDVVVHYYVYLGDIQLLRPSIIDIEHSQGGKTFDALTVRKVTRRTIDETVASPFTRQATMRNHCNELTLQMREGLSLVFRAYNEGIAYRFVWEGKPGRVNKEIVDYRFYGDWTATVPYVKFDSLRYEEQYRPSSENHYTKLTLHHEVQYSSSFESQYTTLPLSQLDQSRLCFLPLMVHCDNGVKVCITESALLDYPGLYLQGTGGRPLVGDHAP